MPSITPRRWSRRLGPVRLNFSGPRLTSVTARLGPLFRLTLWRRR
jgi:hypothetical protein